MTITRKSFAKRSKKNDIDIFELEGEEKEQFLNACTKADIWLIILQHGNSKTTIEKPSFVSLDNDLGNYLTITAELGDKNTVGKFAAFSVKRPDSTDDMDILCYSELNYKCYGCDIKYENTTIRLMFDDENAISLRELFDLSEV